MADKIHFADTRKSHYILVNTIISLDTKKGGEIENNRPARLWFKNPSDITARNICDEVPRRPNSNQELGFDSIYLPDGTKIFPHDHNEEKTLADSVTEVMVVYGVLGVTGVDSTDSDF